MRFRRTLAEPDESIELNLIPLIDIIMFLLIFFISTTSMMQEKGLSVDKPQSAASSSSGEDTNPSFCPSRRTVRSATTARRSA
jgi:biopolymer transport protein ExbD